jgi:hypothetical protein
MSIISGAGLFIVACSEQANPYTPTISLTLPKCRSRFRLLLCGVDGT